MEQTKVEEIWIPCKFINEKGILEEFPNYEVSDFGMVRSLNYQHIGKPRVLKPVSVVHSNGTYFKVHLWKDKKSYWKSVHRLVLSSFCSKGYFNGAVVDHVDSDPSNNRLSNLRWTTQQENSHTLHRKEAQAKIFTNRVDLSKQVEVTFLEDGHSEVFPSTKEVARSLGLPKQTVSYCIHKQKGFYKKLNLLFEYI